MGSRDALAAASLEALDGSNVNRVKRSRARLPIAPASWRSPALARKTKFQFKPEASYLPNHEKPSRPHRRNTSAPHPDKTKII